MKAQTASSRHSDLYRRSNELIELARKTFSIDQEGNRALLKVPREITLDNLPLVLDTCPIIKRVYIYRVKLNSMEKGPPLTEGQKLGLLIDSAKGIAQLAHLLINNEAALNKVREQQGVLTKEEGQLLDDLVIALSRILLSKSIIIRRKVSRKA
ncbi:MAG: hypothetical protein RDV48_09755 [Candidatus Eremiobacteraeota bacterium]|nr:hypothetical protein [Candidatus Eremiobacteraeota bacterium]